MSAKGIYLSQECHLVNLIPPASHSSTVTTGKFSMKGWRHASIILLQGSAGTPPVVTLEASDDGSPEALTAIAFNLHKCETAYDAASGDVLGARVAETNAGFTPASKDNVFYVIELDADTLPAGKSSVELVATSPTSNLLSAVVVLSGGRFDHDQSETVLV